MSTTALLIIDMQKAMFADESEQPYRGREVLANNQRLLEAARKTNLPVIFVQHTLEAGKFQKGSPTWEICSEITPLPTEYVVEKSKRDSFYKTGLHELLQKLGIDSLIITGMQTERCVDTTCRRAVSLDYHCVLVSDAHSTFDTEVLPAERIVAHHNDVLSGVLELKTTQDVIGEMEGM